jgi:toxin ParE1/3/4
MAYPKASPIIHSAGIRRKKIRGFPYSILYALEDDHLRVIAVPHEKRFPHYWKSRV